MKIDQAWKKNGAGTIEQYDFSPPRNWDQERIREEMELVTQALRSVRNMENHEFAAGWLRLARQLPQALRLALIFELELGNVMKGIGRSGWPNEDSIVVNVSERFNLASRQKVLSEVRWRRLDDPHYCREELSQKVNGVEYLIIT
jgi:hypothetical protein